MWLAARDGTWFEDAELSLRCWMAGLRVVFVREARVDHDYEFSRHGTKLYFLERNRLIMVATCYERKTLWVLAPALFLYEMGMAVIALAQGWGRDKLRGWWWLWQNRRWLRQQRSRIQSSRRAGDRAVVPVLSGRFDSDVMPRSRAIDIADRAFGAYWGVARRVV